MSVDIEQFNADWLDAWTSKDVDRLVAFYSPDTVYKDPQTAAGLNGREALSTYLTGLFGATPPMTYKPDETWPIPGGYCGRWYCEVGEDGKDGLLRGFDLVIIEHGLIKLNEVYVHEIPEG